MSYGFLKEIMELLIYFCVFIGYRTGDVLEAKAAEGDTLKSQKAPEPKEVDGQQAPEPIEVDRQQAPEPKEVDAQQDPEPKKGMHNRHQNKKRGAQKMMTLQQCPLMTMMTKG